MMRSYLLHGMPEPEPRLQADEPTPGATGQVAEVVAAPQAKDASAPCAQADAPSALAQQSGDGDAAPSQ